MDQTYYYHAFLGTNSMRGSQGLYHVALRKDDLTLQVRHTCPALNGDYICIAPDGRSLYAAYEVIYYQGRPSAAVGAYRIDDDGALTLLNTRHVDGQMACFCSTDHAGTHLLSSSYMSGSVTVTPILPDGSLGEDCRVIRQPVRRGRHWPSIHSVYETPDCRYILSTNVGLDRVFLHRLRGDGWVQAFEVAVEGRPRQAAFSADGRFVYVSTEAGGEVFVLAYDPDGPELLRPIQRISTTRPGWSGHAETAGIKLSPDGNMLLVANRAMELNSLAVYSVDQAGGTLNLTGHVGVHGVFPRDFDFTPDSRYVLVGLQFSDTLELFEVDQENRTLASRRRDIPLPCCSCVKFLKEGDAMHNGG